MGGEGPSGGKKVKVFVRWPERRLCVSKGLGLDVWSRIVLARERGGSIRKVNVGTSSGKGAGVGKGGGSASGRMRGMVVVIG